MTASVFEHESIRTPPPGSSSSRAVCMLAMIFSRRLGVGWRETPSDPTVTMHGLPALPGTAPAAVPGLQAQQLQEVGHALLERRVRHVVRVDAVEVVDEVAGDDPK